MTLPPSRPRRTSAADIQATDPYEHYVRKSFLDVLEQRHVISYTLYVRDPLTGDIRLYKSHNIRHRETIDGFILSSEQAQRRRPEASADPSPECQYFPAAQAAALLGRDPLPADIRDRISHIASSGRKGCHLYRSFVEREQIVSCYRIEHNITRDDREHTAILFINLNKYLTKKPSSLAKALKTASDALHDHLCDISDHLDREFPTPLRRLATILQPIKELAANRKSTTVEKFFEHLLNSVVRAMELGKDGFGTIHLFDQRTGTLELLACTNRMPSLGKTISAFDGDGVISWVALNRKPLLIYDMSSSDFDDLRIKHAELDSFQSELAVPLVIGDNVVGVLNVESVVPNAFTPQHAHTLWYAAAEAAVAYEWYNGMRRVEESEQTAASNLRRALESESIAASNMRRAQESEQRLAELLEITNTAMNLGTRNDELLHKLATVIGKWVKATFVEIWQFDPAMNSFCHAGANYAHFERDVLPRDDGASRFVVSHAQPVWMSVIQANGEYRANFWDASSGSWRSGNGHYDAGRIRMPETVNSIVVKERTTGELGIPICAHDRCIGVCWLKYTNDDVADPSADDMALVLKLSGHVAIVVDSMRQLADREDKDFRDKVRKQQHLAVGNLKAAGMRGHVLYEQCHGRIGGDFCVFVPGGERSWACLLGDVAGHGYDAALKMLPLITAFRIFRRKSDSPSYILHQLAEANESGVLGTALCFAYFEQESIEQAERGRIRRFVKACSAGHPPLIVISRHGSSNHVGHLPTRNGPAETQLLGAGELLGFGEDCIEVHPGDLLIGYTDGVDEAGAKVRSDLFQRRQIEAIAIANEESAPEIIARKIYDAAKAHSHSVFSDDVTIAVFRIEERDDGSVPAST